MGQAYLIANLTKRQFIYPHQFGDGYKLMEFGMSSGGTMTALAILLAIGNGQGSGDLDSNSPAIGSWAGDQIVVAGQYAEAGRYIEDVPMEDRQAVADIVFTEGYRKPQNVTLYHWALHRWEDVSMPALDALMADEGFREDFDSADNYLTKAAVETLSEWRKNRPAEATNA